MIDENENENQNSTYHVLLLISVAVVVSVGVGWFLLDKNSRVDVEEDTGEELAAPSPSFGNATEEAEAPELDIESALRKARLAAQAGMLAEPENRSAIRFYKRILEFDAGHEVANAELNVVLGELATVSANLLLEQRFEEAYKLAVLVAGVRPDHPLVNEVQQTLDQRTTELVTQVMQLAEGGQGDVALSTLASAEALPGRNPAYFEALRESVAEILEAGRVNNLAANVQAQANRIVATETWLGRARDAISAGNLITPVDASARDILAERSTLDEQGIEVQQELILAIIAEIEKDIIEAEFSDAEQLMQAAADLNVDSDTMSRLQMSLDLARVELQSSRVLSTSSFVRVSMARPEYPQQARRRGVTGWAVAEFTVTSSGQTAQIAIVDAEPEGVFNESAIAAVSKWTFEPRVFRGQPIDQRAAARLVFDLEK